MARAYARANQSGRIALAPLVAMAVIALGLAIGYWLLSHQPHVERRPAASQPPPSVELARVQRGPVAPQITGYGRAIAARETQVATRVGGRLEAFAEGVEPGRVVESGALLATLDADDYRLAVRSAEAALAQAQADLAVERGEQIQAQNDYQAFGRQLSSERRALVLREPQLKAAQAAVDSAQVALESAQLELARTRIEAPYRGMIEERLVGPGGSVAANTALLSLVDVSHFWLRVSLSNEALGWLDSGTGDTAGSAVTLTSDAWPPGASRRGRVYSVLPSLEENGLMAQLLVRVDDPLALEGPGPALRLGDVVAASFDATPRDDLLALPNAALRDGDQVWTLDDEERLQILDVDVVHRGEHQVLIAADAALADAGRVIVSALAQPREGMALSVVETDNADSDLANQAAHEPEAGAGS
ncbi:efflux RND transporter periplasmic adaptor subunit [Halomonas sp. HP20-15]|uniref:efflux RND transporter periplasmic adaptor subunit n=1 Tax=Halomonas sp. HP20-15 TaxID=3085901 RepID=UPI0029818E5F|nr:efflux RND transporter periplasmic adaptor subunit [Halomonas sp. HP20-15]MDW5377420.1 efflux RND transporter periplasmic adaptor subunit [Halomonas sp. HP20-15]